MQAELGSVIAAEALFHLKNNRDYNHIPITELLAPLKPTSDTREEVAKTAFATFLTEYDSLPFAEQAAQLMQLNETALRAAATSAIEQLSETLQYVKVARAFAISDKFSIEESLVAENFMTAATKINPDAALALSKPSRTEEFKLPSGATLHATKEIANDPFIERDATFLDIGLIVANAMSITEQAPSLIADRIVHANTIINYRGIPIPLHYLPGNAHRPRMVFMPAELIGLSSVTSTLFKKMKQEANVVSSTAKTEEFLDYTQRLKQSPEQLRKLLDEKPRTGAFYQPGIHSITTPFINRESRNQAITTLSHLVHEYTHAQGFGEGYAYWKEDRYLERNGVSPDFHLIGSIAQHVRPNYSAESYQTTIDELLTIAREESLDARQRTSLLPHLAETIPLEFEYEAIRLLDQAEAGRLNFSEASELYRILNDLSSQNEEIKAKLAAIIPTILDTVIKETPAIESSASNREFIRSLLSEIRLQDREQAFDLLHTIIAAYKAQEVQENLQISDAALDQLNPFGKKRYEMLLRQQLEKDLRVNEITLQKGLESQRQLLQQTGEVVSKNNKIRYLADIEAVRNEYITQRITELEPGLSQTDAAKQAREEAQQVKAFYNSTERRTIAPFPAHRLTTDGASNKPGYIAARLGRIEAGSFLVHEMTHSKRLAKIDPMTLDYDARVNAEVDAYVAQATYLWKNKYNMEFSKTGFNNTSRSDESIEKREAPQINREAIEEFVRANYQLEQSALFAGKERENYGATAAKQLQEKQQLFTQVQSLATTLGTVGSLSPNDLRAEQVALISRIFEHSVADGIELIKKFPLTPVEISQMLIRKDFTIKHRELVTRLIEQLPLSATNHFLLSGVSILLVKNLEEKKGNPSLPNRRQPVSDQAKLLSTEIDNYYAKFLRTKEFRPITEPISTHSKGEFLAFNNIETAAYNLYGRYYTDTAKKILHAELVASGSSSEEAATRLENLANFNELARITTSSLQGFCKKNGLKWDAVVTKLEKARHTSMLYPLEQRLAQNELTKELNESLKDRGGRVLINPQTDQYEVIFDQEPPLVQRTHTTSTPVKLPERGTVLVDETSNGPQLFDLRDDGYSSLSDDPALSSLDLADYRTKNGKLFLQNENGTIHDDAGKVLWREKNKYLMDVKVIAGKPYLQISNHPLILLDKNQNRIGADYNVMSVGEFNGKLTFSVETVDGYAILDAESKTVLQTFPPEHVPSIPIKSGDHIFTFVTRSSYNGSAGLYIDDVFYPKTTNVHGTSINNGIVYRQVIDKVDGTSYIAVDNRKISKKEHYTFHGKEAFFVNNKLHFYAHDNLGRNHIRNEDGEVFFADSDRFQQRMNVYIVGDTFFITELTSKGIAIRSSDGNEYGKGAYIKNENEISFGEKSISYIDRSNTTPELTTIHFEKRPLSAEERVVNQHEQYKINLLNVVHTPTAENIELHTDEIRRQYWRDYPSSFKELSYDFKLAETITAAIKTAPHDFLNSIAARRDQSPSALARELTYLIAPELNIEKQPQPSFFNRVAKWFSPGAKAEQVNQQPNPDPADFLKPSDSQMLLGAGIFDDKRSVIECRENETAYLSSDLFGDYNKETAEWQKHYFPLSTRLSDPVKEATYMLPDIGDRPSVILPKSLDATVIRDRVHGINAQGKEIPLATAINALGEVTAEIPNNQKISKVVYSARKSKNPEPMRELAAEQYNTFRKAFEKAHGDSMSSPIAILPEETKVFLNQIKPLPPKEQIIAIQEYSRTLGFYDFNNSEVNREKFGKPLEEQLAIMQQRVSDLKANNPKLAPQLATKQFAGVCADFANLTVAMLRQAGFISGITTGFQPQGKVATVSDSHGSAFVLWPNDHGEYRAIPVDGTPQSKEAQQNVRLPSIVEREAEIEEQLLAQGDEKQKEIEKMIQAIESQDIAQLRSLENGKLETTLNTMLQTMVKESHLVMLNGILDYYWYTPLHKLTLKTPHNQAYFQEQLAAELPRIRERTAPSDRPAGNALFEMIDKFADRFGKTGIVTNRSTALNTLEQSFDAARDSLNDTEAKAAYAIINYLRANRMIDSDVEIATRNSTILQ